MPSPRISIDLRDRVYFVTFTVKRWYYIFDRHERFKILEDSFSYCQRHKGLKVYAFVFMLNHLHFVAQAPDLIGVVRDMKKHLSKELRKNISMTEPSVLSLFKAQGETFNLWKSGNYPKLIETEKFFRQKVDYIHSNPVKKLYVHFPEDWRWSSASKVPTRITISEIDE